MPQNCTFSEREWTDDTQMGICIAEVTAFGRAELEAVGQRFLDWYASGPKDVGVSTAAVLGGVQDEDPLALPAAADRYVRAHPRGGAGNGSLMHTAPLALAHLGDDRAIAAAATAISGLTHGDPLAGEACVLWCTAIDRAIRQERLDGVRDGLALLPADRAAFWSEVLDAAETQAPATFVPNGFVVTALQAATPPSGRRADDPARHLQDALVAAVRIGHDTDTVAAIAGGLLGARWGASAVPAAWRDLLHGWPGLRAADLVRLAETTASHAPSNLPGDDQESPRERGGRPAAASPFSSAVRSPARPGRSSPRASSRGSGPVTPTPMTGDIIS